MAQNTAPPASGDATVTVVKRLTLVNEADLDFGKVIPAPVAGQVILSSSSGACVATNGVVTAGGCSPAVFVGAGTRNQIVIVRLNSLVSLTGPGQPMNLTNMVMTGAPDLVYLGTFGTGLRYRISTGSGVFDYRVGGRLNVNANQLPGVYAGQFTMTVDYM